jgi:hypothetical protein
MPQLTPAAARAWALAASQRACCICQRQHEFDVVFTLDWAAGPVCQIGLQLVLQACTAAAAAAMQLVWFDGCGRGITPVCCTAISTSAHEKFACESDCKRGCWHGFAVKCLLSRLSSRAGGQLPFEWCVWSGSASLVPASGW